VSLERAAAELTYEGEREMARRALDAVRASEGPKDR
jgi:hypothetical protein